MPLNPHDFELLRGIIADRTGNVVSPEQEYLLNSRLEALTREQGLATLGDLITALRRTPQSLLHDKVAEAMTINETSFFRDGDLFNGLKKHVIPRFIEENRTTRSLSIWSAACSTGQEPYSMAMMLLDTFPELANWRVNILATDYSERVLNQAQSGTYSQFEVNRGVPAKLLTQFFTRAGMRWTVAPQIKKIVTFQRLNLKSPLPFATKFDIVFLRNVLIYFSKEEKERILTRVSHVLRPQGCLLLGGGETLMTVNSPFTRDAIGDIAYYRPAGQGVLIR